MPLRPDDAARLASEVLAIAQDAEGAVVAMAARYLGSGLQSPRWADEKLSDLQTFRQRVGLVAQEYNRRAGAAIGNAVEEGADLGRKTAAEDIAGTRTGLARDLPTPLPGRDAVVALAQEATGAVAGTANGILRTATDAYRQVVADVSGRVLLGAQTRQQATQEALNRLAAKGISGFTDRAGRRWGLDSYLEMATRTAAQRAMVLGHTTELQSRGHDLVIVSNAPQECVRCRPWEGKVLALSGSGGVRTMESATTGRMVKVSVDGTLQQATGAGLFHPGCRHSVSLFLPGATMRPTGPTADPQGDRDRQRLRALERRVRAAKRQELVALTPADKALARARVRRGQAEIRDHVAKTGILRVSAREQLVLPKRP